jgi:hypothetical protein
VSGVPRIRRTISSKRNEVARVATRPDVVAGADQTTTYLLLQLRKANRTILRLRACARAAHEGNEEELRAALASLRPGDLEP